MAGETEDGPDHVRGVEKPIIRNFQRYTGFQLEDSKDYSLWKWLSIMQYNDAPTRLLDWTSSPLIALYFALGTEENRKEDGLVWCINPNELAIIDVPEEFKAGEGVRYQLYTADQLDQKIERATLRKNQRLGSLDPHFQVSNKRDITTVLDDLDGFCSSGHPFVLFLDPPADERICNQAVVYSIMASPTAVFDEWLEKSPHGCKRVIISASLKEQIYHKLMQSNITERLLIPGLEGLSQWIAKYYSPRNVGPVSFNSSLNDSIKTIRVNSWENLLDVLFADEITKSSNVHTKHVFRGLPNVNFALASSLQRLCKNSPDIRSIEEQIVSSFQRYAHKHKQVVSSSNIFDWLSYAQHFSTPTRLIDWSESPLVALFFAVSEGFEDKDGMVITLNCEKASNYFPDFYLPTKNSGLLTPEEIQHKIRGSDSFMLSALKEMNVTNASTRNVNMEDLEKLGKDPFLLFMVPPSMDERITNQAGVFSFLSKADASFDKWMLAHSDCFIRIVIPAKMKAEVRDKLDQSNINERVLFPGLRGTAQFLSRYYKFRPKN
eukprot:TRINITY_DN5403_c0_g1_i1.p1 TRINITY_DN5403_c0_g1~~TRINITY_DN5403_c0_g1_i1.p1  ORF type:complete len:630 (+),score=147.38 TRINITY_DN5403_c0_g1_i1:248-1891(+)